MGTKKRSSGKRRRRLSVLEDYDQDGVPNFDDCRPLDPTMHVDIGPASAIKYGLGVAQKYGRGATHAEAVRVTATRQMGTVAGKYYGPSIPTPARRGAAPIISPSVSAARERSTARQHAAFEEAKKWNIASMQGRVYFDIYGIKRIAATKKKAASFLDVVSPLSAAGISAARRVTDIGADIGREITTKLGQLGTDIQKQVPMPKRPLQETILFGGFIGKGERAGRLAVAPTPARVGLERVDIPQVGIGKKPSIVSTITSLPSRAVKELSEQYTWIRATPSERAIITMVPSVKAETETFTKGVETYETKWEPHIEGGYFIGSEAQYAQQTREYEQLQRGQAQLEKQYGTFTGLETQIPHEKKEALWGIPATYEREQERAAKWTAERIPSLKDIPVTWFERDVAIRESFQKAAREQPEVFTAKQLAHIQEVAGKPPELPMWAERIFQGEQFIVDYQKGMVEGVREKPFETIATTALFAAMPPAIKGLKKVGKVTRMAPATKIVEPWVPTIGKIGKISYPTFKRSEAIKIGVEGGLLPPMMRHIPTVAGIGMGGAYIGSLGYELYSAKAEERIRTLGRMTSTEIMPMIAGTYIGYKYTPKIAGWLYTMGKKKIPLPEIGVEKGYPIRPDISAKALEKSFMRSTLIEPPEVFHAAGRKIVPMEPIPKSAVLPGEVPGGFYAWEAVPFVKPKIRTVMPGSSELPAEYYAPIYEAYFSKVQAGVTPKFSLFGMTTPDVSFPSAIRTRAWGLREIPTSVRAKSKKAMASFIEKEAEKGVFYMPLMKGEYEAVLPVGTQVQRVGYKYYTTVEGVRVPIHQVEAVLGDVIGKDAMAAIGKDVMAIGKARIKYGGEYYDKAVPFITPTRLGYAEVSRGFRDIAYAPYQRKVSYYPQLPSFMPSYYDKYVPKLHIPKIYALPEYKTPKYKEPAYPYMPREYMMWAYEYGLPTHKPRKYKPPIYGYDIPMYGITELQYAVHTYKIPEYKYRVPEYAYKIPEYLHMGFKIPEYKIPGYEYIILPIRDTKVQIFGHEMKRRKYRRKYQFEEYPWREKHFIPTLQELMKLPKGMEIKTPKAFAITEMKMPKMPKGLM